jgi:hypothetical protein
MKNIPIALRYILGAAVLAVIVLGIQAWRESAKAAGWDALAEADRKNDTPDALAEALRLAKDTPAEPWVAFTLASRLYEQGGHDNMDRAHTVAQQALDRYPEHPAAPSLKRVVETTDSFLKLAPG